MDNKTRNIPTPEELGIPSGSLDPIKRIEMEGDFLRGLIKGTESRPLILRIGAILVGMFFIFPGLFFLFISIDNFFSNGSLIGGLGYIFFSLLYTAVGVVIIWDNIRKHKIRK